MARIPVYSQQVSASGSLGPGAVARTPNIQDPTGQALQAVGRSLGQVGQIIQRKDEEDAAAWTGEALSKARREWTEQLIERQQNAEPGAPGFTPAVMKDFDEYVAKSLENAPSETAKRFLNERLRSFGDSLYDKSIGFEASARVSHRLNTVDQAVENIRVAVESDPSQYKESLAEQLAIIDALEVSPEVKESKRMQAIETVSVAAVQGEIRDDAEAALKALNAKPGESGNLAVEALTLTARRALRNEAESILRQRDAATTAAKTRARALISDARSRMEAGYALPDAELGAINGVLDMAQDPDIENDWNELRGVQAFLGSFQKLAPSQMRSVIDGELSPAANDKGATRLEFLALNAAESALNRQNTAINQGRGLSYALQTGIVSDIGDISTQEGRQLRAAVSGSLDARFGLPQQPLLPEEVAEISASLVDMPVTEKLAMGMQLAHDMGDKGFDAIAQIGDNVYQSAVGLSLASPAHEVVALDILAGQQMLRENKELAPAKTDVDLSLSQFMPAFKNLPEQGAVARQAAVAHYVKTSAWDDSWTLEESFQAVLGSGVGEYNGAQIVLPVSVDEGDFEDAIEAMKDDDLAALSLSSAPRYQDGQIAKAEDIADDAELESVGSGQYIVRMPNGYLVDDQGEFYVLSLDAERVNRLKNAPSDRSVSGFRAISPDSVGQ